ncbi:hypothetical protein GQ600_23022 [Phytophthora cactorum]|nr:hypothetical protein GQ600_23022 [Phytophthora cactorum]
MPGSKRNHTYSDDMNQLLGMTSDGLDENLVDVDVPIRISKADTAMKRLKQMSSLEKFKSLKLYSIVSPTNYRTYQPASFRLQSST